MAKSPARPWPRALTTASRLVSFAVICGILYWAKQVLIPLALASLVTFLLTPVLMRLQRWGLPRIPAVVLLAVILATATGGFGWLVYGQVASLASQIPHYKQNIKQRMADFRSATRPGILKRVESTLQQAREELEQQEEAEAERLNGPDSAAEPVQEEPVPVRLQPAQGWLPGGDALAPVFETAATAGLVVVLVIFMLIQREDLLHRLVSLAGSRSLTITTKALNEASQRISRYLLMQFIINATFGTAVTIGLSILGVPYSLIWGLCAAVFRYIPYVGPWVAAILPVGVSLITSAGWTQPLAVVALFLVLELLSNNVMEPWLYGQSVGLSPVAVIVAAVFWTWLWGPVGLILATPLSVCLTVLGKHVPALSIFDRLLSDQPALSAHIWLYQRLLSRDEDGAEEVVEAHLEEYQAEKTCGELLIPVMSLAKRDWLADRIATDDMEYLLETMQELVTDHIPEEKAVMPAEDSEEEAEPVVRDKSQDPLVLGWPVREVDEVVLDMARRVCGAQRFRFQLLSSETLISEKTTAVREGAPACVCVSSLAPGDIVQTRLVCKRLRTDFPDLKIVVGRWGAPGGDSGRESPLRSAGADQVVSELGELCEALVPIAQFHARADRPAEDRQEAGLAEQPG